MALADEDKQKIVFLLGYPGKVLIVGSTHFHSIVTKRLENLNSFIEDQVDDLLTSIDATRTKLEESKSKGNVRRIGDIELDTNLSVSVINQEYRRLLKELSRLLDIPLVTPTGSRVIGP